jgi:phosphoribosyl 1,2-cyclic phosphate phosphodiesterase
VPRIGNDWGACDPGEPRNRRSRCALLVERFGVDGARPTRLLVDTGPDMRGQLLAAEVDLVDAVVYTHAHADHTHGIDDLRIFWQRTQRLLDVYGDQATIGHLTHAFGYCFRSSADGLYPAILKGHVVDPEQTLTVAGPGGPITVRLTAQVHGDIRSLGVRVGGLGYSCDVSDLPEAAQAALAGLDVWIVDALRHRPHVSHFSVSEALTWIDRLAPRRGVLTHMHSDLDYATLAAALPAGVEPAYDGMRLDFAAD